MAISRFDASEQLFDQSRCAGEDVDEIIDQILPGGIAVDGTDQIIVPIRCQYLASPNGTSLLRQLNYLTGEPTDDRSFSNHDLISVDIRLGVDSMANVVPKILDRYPIVAEIKHGLEYRPQSVPSRLPELWKRAYTKPGVSPNDFNIECIPPMGPGSIAAPEWCVMQTSIARFDRNGRTWQATLKINFAESRLSDWALIEEQARNIIESRIAAT